MRRAQVGLTDFQVVPNGAITVGAVSALWLEAIRRQVSAGSLAAYESRVKLHILPTLGSKRLNSLTVTDVDHWQEGLAAKGLAVSTRKEIRSCLVTMITWARKRDYVMRNVAELSPGPKGGTRPVSSLTQEQAKAVLSAVEGWRLEAAVVLMMTAGLRIGEALGLRWIDIQDNRLTVSGTLVTKPRLSYQPTPKTAESLRTVALSRMALQSLEAHRERQNLERLALGLEPAQYVFLTPSQTLLDPSTLARDLKERTAHLGINVHPHKLRHTAVSLMLDKGVPLDVVSKVVGHSSIRTTADLYQSLLDGGREAAADAMDSALG
jgi:integrase